MTSKEELLQQAKHYSYKPEILEKVYRLLETLEQLVQIPYLKDRLALKGGTALNLFHFEKVPRLSVDIDLNYIGKLNRAAMLEERSIINNAIEQILLQNQFEKHRNPGNHAGGKMVWRYPSVLGQKGNLEIDLNYMYRQPLWQVEWLQPQLTTKNNFQFPVLDIHELTAGKLSALMTRTASRDLYDAHHLLTKFTLNNEKLRFAFVVYISMAKLDPLALSPTNIKYDEIEIRNRLLPVLRQKEIARSSLEIKQWARKLVKELQQGLSKILPLQKKEFDFISKIREQGEIDASLITNDLALREIVENHPALKWAVKRGSKVAVVED